VTARRNYRCDRQYVIRAGEVAIVDENTGRIAEGRKWRDGLHQAVEAQEKLDITDDGGQAARITVQDYFRRFPHLAGMTGTASNATREFRNFYGLSTFVVPTHRPSRRTALPPRIFAGAEAKWKAVVDEVRAVRDLGRPVLIGTRSIDHSRILSRLLQAAELEHAVLNACELADEARIVAEAGTGGRITVATNMAGRGTDIVLAAAVEKLGGLHVVLTEMHDAARIDRQFIGRCARQGDPGSFRLFLSLEDQLLTNAGIFLKPPKTANSAAELPRRAYLSAFLRAQRTVEARGYFGRKQLLFFEKRRISSAFEFGFDPYLDLPS
jgi:preprotein translocase subunit SecA